MLDNKSLYFIAVCRIPCPDNNISDCSISNPSLSPVEDIATLYFSCGGLKTGCVTSISWFCKAETHDLVKVHSRL
jgi:hypothetical protein